jgi:hypothetical protein
MGGSGRVEIRSAVDGNVRGLPQANRSYRGG